MRLGDLVDIRKGKKPQSISFEPAPGLRRLIQIDDLRPGAIPKYCPKTPEEVMAKETDVLIAWDGANAGTSNFGLSGVIGSTLAILRSTSRSVHTPYLGHFVRANENYLRARCKGATIPHIDGRVLENLDITLPPLPEQRRIAHILDNADALRSKRSAALAQLDTLTHSIFLDMFGDPDADRWQMVTVADMANHANGGIRTGPFGSQLLHSEFTDSGIAVLGIDNVVENDFRWGQRRHISEAKYRQLARYTVRPGDVLITIMGTLGRCAIVPENIPRAINTKHLCCITLDHGKCLPVFLQAYFLRHPIAQRHLAQKAKGAIMEGLNMGIIKEMPIPLAPLTLQKTFAARLIQLREVQQIEQSSAGKFDRLFSSIQDRAFRGEL